MSSSPEQEDLQAELAAVVAEARAVSNTTDEISQKASKRASGSGSRDFSVSTLVQLMGIPTHTEIDVLETKIDILTSKLTAVLSKVDRITLQLTNVFDQSYLDRIDFQLADLRMMIKKVIPEAIAQQEVQQNLATNAAKANKPEQEKPEPPNSETSGIQAEAVGETVAAKVKGTNSPS